MAMGMVFYSTVRPVSANSLSNVQEINSDSQVQINKQSEESGTFGTVHWVLDSDGTLTLGGGEFGVADLKSPWSECKIPVKKIIFTKTVLANENSYFLFNSLSELQSIEGLNHLDTSNATNMSSMFSGCNGLTGLDVSNFVTQEVRDMSSMFNGCSGLTSLDVSKFDLISVTDMSSMFLDCNNLLSINLPQSYGVGVEDMSSMFSGCTRLASLDMSYLYSPVLKNSSYMFLNCSSLTNLDLSKFDTSSLPDMLNMTDLLGYDDNLKYMTLGDKTILSEYAALVSANWKNHMSTWSGDSNDLIARSKQGMGDTYERVA